MIQQLTASLSLLTIALTGLVSSLPGYTITISNADTISPLPRTEQILKMYPILARIGGCESAGSPDKHPQQFDNDGKVIRGWVSPHDDVGAFQINEPRHLKEAQEMGLNIYSERGNYEYARILYERNGTKDWKASEKCWK